MENSTTANEIRVISYIGDGVLKLENGILSGLPLSLLWGLTLATNLSITRTVYLGGTQWENPNNDFFKSELVPVLSSGGADIACCTFYITSRRAQGLYPLLPVMNERLRGYFVQPGLNRRSSNIFFTPFGMLIALLYNSTIFVFFLAAFLIYFIHSGKPDSERKFWFRISRAFLKGSWWVLIAYSLKNYTLPSKTFSLKVIALTTSLFFFIMNSTYSAFLLSTLTSTLNPIRSFDDLINYGYTVYVNPSIAVNVTTKNKNSPNRVLGRIESFLMATRVGHVHVDHADILSSATHRVGFYKSDACKRISVIPFDSSITTGLYFSPNSSKELRETLNRGLVSLGEFGFLARFQVDYFRGKVHSCPRRHGHIEIEFQHIRSLFEVCGVIMILSLCLFAAEKIIINS